MRKRNVQMTVIWNFLKMEITYKRVLMKKTVLTLLSALLFSSFGVLDFSTLIIIWSKQKDIIYTAPLTNCEVSQDILCETRIDYSKLYTNVNMCEHNILIIQNYIHMCIWYKYMYIIFELDKILKLL